jgi:hypothetical protein
VKLETAGALAECRALPGPLTLAVLPIRYLERRRRRTCHTGVCVRCGYDLRATPDPCPECGAIAAAPPTR